MNNSYVHKPEQMMQSMPSKIIPPVILHHCCNEYWCCM